MESRDSDSQKRSTVVYLRLSNMSMHSILDILESVATMILFSRMRGEMATSRRISVGVDIYQASMMRIGLSGLLQSVRR